MGVFCDACQVIIPGGLDAFKAHLRKRCHDAPYSCGSCGVIYQERKSLFRHITAKHEDGDTEEGVGDDHEHVADGDGGITEEDEDEGGGEEPEEPDECEDDEDDYSRSENEIEENEQGELSNEIKRSVALMILNLRRKGNVTGAVVSLVLIETEQLILSVSGLLKKEIMKNLRQAEVLEAVISESVVKVTVEKPTKGLLSKEEQMKYFESNFGLVMPKPVAFGFRTDQVYDEDLEAMVDVQVPKHFQYISVTDTLVSILQNPVMFKLIESENVSTDGYMRSYLDANYAQQHSLISKYPKTLRLKLYFDDFEVCNPLGSKQTVYKVTGFYFTLDNLPPEENARLRAIHVVAYAFAEDLKTDLGPDPDPVLKVILNEVDKLQTEEGLVVSVNGEPYVLRATCIAFCVDGLAAYDLLGLLSPSANCFCRSCTKG